MTEERRGKEGEKWRPAEQVREYPCHGAFSRGGVHADTKGGVYCIPNRESVYQKSCRKGKGWNGRGWGKMIRQENGKS